MGKYLRKKKHTGLWKILCVAVVLLLVIAIALYLNQKGVLPIGMGPVSTEASGTLDIPETTQKPAASDIVETQTPEVEVTEPVPIELDEGLQVLRIDSYAGVYFEDGSDSIVSDVMMLILKNTSEKDLQLARIDVIYAAFTAEFEVTNLPAGESAVLLEKSRHSAVTEEYQKIEARNIAFFPNPMDLQEERIKLTGTDGVIQVTNISEQDISGEVYIYYKNSAGDLYYGGITYVAKLEDGLAAGETKQIPTRHYSPDDCKFLVVTCGE